jgi:hypothetical protein
VAKTIFPVVLKIFLEAKQISSVPDSIGSAV